MTDGDIPDQAKQFLLHHIDSIAQWEGLLCLRLNAGKDLDAAAIARHLYITPENAAGLMTRLVSRGLVAVTDGHIFRYAPATPELDQVVTLTADLYRQYLIPITNLIHSRPKSRVQEFANAFRIRKD
ncbi:hypothetical protein ABAC460_01195 [Asticcacaulis sp. AC460]|uniref:MarR family transcriptional regulator n=1 Tax=Asticcacaulis sp. AC460 TaxID=1282360 RepID=UPI0003C40217|nr:MarR family transcriptional regulator [Asticcacaulis sp. AC460]ESQ93350.1 hypothetical protein ABAC460_01195 [Asticcacaulis sp. AC460]